MDSPAVKYAVPAVGNLLGTIMLMSPCKAVWQMHKSRELGAINPLPYPLTCLNCLGWMIYGVVISDPLIVPANVIGVVAGVIFTMVVLPLCASKMQDILLGLMAGGTLYFAVLGMVSAFAFSPSIQKHFWGTSAIAILMCYYLIPLSTMVHIIRSKDASSIYVPLALAAACNGGLWTIYGLAINDFNVWGPNAFGVLMATIQMALKLVYRQKRDTVETKKAEGPPCMNGLPSECGSHHSELIMAARGDSRCGLDPQASVDPLLAHAPDELHSLRHDTNQTWVTVPMGQQPAVASRQEAV